MSHHKSSFFFCLKIPCNARLAPGENKCEQTDSSHPNNNGPVVSIPNAPDAQNTNDGSAEHAEQDADDEAAEDTDDTRSVVFMSVLWFKDLLCGFSWEIPDKTVRTEWATFQLWKT